MATRFPWFPFWINRWLSSVARKRMSLEAQGAYINLLACYWAGNCQGLPTNSKELAVMAEIRGGEDRENDIISQVIRGGFKEKNGLLHNKVMRAIYRETVSASKVRTNAGKAGAKARWQTQCDRNATPMAKNAYIRDQISESESESEKSRDIISEQPAPETPKGADKIADEVTDPPTEIDWNPVETYLSTLPNRVRTSCMEFLGFIANGFTSQKSMEGKARELEALYSSLQFEPGDHQKLFEKAVDATVKHGAKTVEYLRACVRSSMNKWRDSHAR